MTTQLSHRHRPASRTTPRARSGRPLQQALRRGALLLPLLAPLLLAGCGGGGGAGQPGNDVAPPPPPDPPPPAAVAGLRCTGPKSTGWCWQAPQPWAPVIDGVVFTDSLNGWVLGEAPQRTTDGGVSWQELALPQATLPLGLRFASATDGWLLAREGGRLWRTQDGGQSWSLAATLPISQAVGLALVGSRTLLVTGAKSSGDGESHTLLSDDAAATWRTAANAVHPERVTPDGGLWSWTDERWALSTDGGRSFATPAAWEDPSIVRLVLTRDNVVTAWTSVATDGGYENRAWQQTASTGGWTPMPLPPAPATGELYDVGFWATGGWARQASIATVNSLPSTVLTLWHREPGASDWVGTTLPAGVLFQYSPAFVDGRTAWWQAKDRAAVLTTDGGRSWVSDWSPSADPTDDLRVLRRDGGGALLAGYGGAGYRSGTERWYRSTDNGRSWRAMPGTQADGNAITGLWMFDGTRGLALTSGGRWLDSTNAGHDWVARPDSTRLPGDASGLQVTPDGTAWVVALRKPQPPSYDFGQQRESPAGDLYRSTDQGRNWTRVPLPEPAAGRVLAVQFVDSRVGFLTAQTRCEQWRFFHCFEKMWATRDGGSNWQAVGDEHQQGGQLVMWSATEGVRVGIGAGNQGFARRSVALTTDGGATWTAGGGLPDEDTLSPQRLISAGGRLWLLCNSVTPGGMAGPGAVLSSSNGGRSWASQALPTPADLQLVSDVGPESIVLRDIAFADDRHGWIVGRQGLVLATTDGGLTWVRQASGSRQTLVTVHAPSANTVWIGGTARSILATASGGR